MADSPLPAPGTLVDLRAHRWRVVRVRRDRAIARLDLARGDLRRVFLIPFDRPRARAAGERGRRLRRAGALRQLAALVARAGPARLPASLVDSDADVLPFQIEPALALEGGARRVLVADEVGLGKTVQAGLAIAERVRRDPDARVLVLAPRGSTPSGRSSWPDGSISGPGRARATGSPGPRAPSPSRPIRGGGRA
ncbi:MAG: hypothetical protein R2752_16430 [Vicinamibacterales bacterium]